MKGFLGVSDSLEVSSLSSSVGLLYFFALITEEGFPVPPFHSQALHSVGCIFPFLPCFLLFFFSQPFVRPFTRLKPFFFSSR